LSFVLKAIHRQQAGAYSFIVGTPLVGAGLPAMVVNDYAGELDERGALESIASRLAPTGIALLVFPGIA
jgi:hypothetical protein